MARTRTEQREFIPHYVRQQALRECNRICAHCGTPLDYNTNFTLEHVIPLAKGGKNDVSNYVALCETCNKAKSDDIVEPNKYYTYLPKEKKAQLQALFEEYLKTTDWLGYDNLFVTDQFDLTAHIPVFNRSGQIDIPTTFHVQKLRRSAAFEYLTMYKGRLSLEDKDLITYDERDLQTPYYRITQGDKTIMLSSVYIMKKAFEDRPDHKENVLYVDCYFNHELKQNQRTIPMLYNIIQVLLTKIQATLSSKQKATTITCMIRTPSSDTYGAETLKEIQKCNPKTYNLYAGYDNPDGTGSCIIYLTTILFQGNYQDLKTIAKEHGYDNVSDFCKNTDPSTLQAGLDNRLADAEEIKQRKAPEKIKKKDKKRKKKR